MVYLFQPSITDQRSPSLRANPGPRRLRGEYFFRGCLEFEILEGHRAM